MNPNVLNAKYAVRGELAIKADQLNRELKEGKGQFPFKKITYCNIGNPQQLKQKPMTFFRQVSALLEMKDWLFDQEKLAQLKTLFRSDAILRAQKILQFCPTIGAYSSSNGIFEIRQAVAEFIESRDGYSANPENIFLTNGASEGIARIMNMIVSSPQIGVMIPIPQYPLYTATLAMLNGQVVPYYLNEEREWSLDLKELKRALQAGRSAGHEVRAIVLINPGNPTGSILTRENLHEIIRFCREERLIILADEVYQENIYDPVNKPFVSCKQALMELGQEYSEAVELISFHSTSKGLIGECGRRGGYFECHGLTPEIMEQVYKVSSISLCSNILGQVMVYLMVKPPQPGDPSFDLYAEEKQEIWSSLQRRSKILTETLASLEGVSCVPASGAMYLFPRFQYPEKMIASANNANQEPDVFYALALLEATGVCMVPGSGFGQAEGTFHLRTTFLPAEEEFEEFCGLIRNFHTRLMAQYK